METRREFLHRTGCIIGGMAATPWLLATANARAEGVLVRELASLRGHLRLFEADLLPALLAPRCLKEQIKDVIARSQPKPEPAPPNPPRTKKKRDPQRGSPEAIAAYAEEQRRLESEPPEDPAELAPLIAKLKGGGESNAAAADAQ